MAEYTIGLDFGTNSVRALIVNVADGEEVATAVWQYAHGQGGVVCDSQQPHLARQHPQDYLDGMAECVRDALHEASLRTDFYPHDVIAIGVDTTGSTPMPVDREGIPLAMREEFSKNPDAMAWLWKDHTAHAEAVEITNLASRIRPNYLSKCGGVYSAEWFWSKLLHCIRTNPEVSDAIHTWVEISDWIPAVLTGTERPDKMRRGICAAGHKGMFHHSWGGYPDEEFLRALDERLVRVRRTLPSVAHTISGAAGALTERWAGKFGLRAGIPVATGAIDAHLGAVGSGIAPKVLVKIIGTSTCDMMVSPLEREMTDIPGLCGIVPESILPGCYGLEAGHSAVGDIFNWFVQSINPGGETSGGHERLTEQAAILKPGETGLLGLDWHNGNRTILVDQRLTGLLIGMTLATTPAEIYRALIESTAFGARRIIERLEEYGLKVERVINCGGIAVKNPLVMQIYADVLCRTMEVTRSEQTCALGAAIAAVVSAGKKAGGYDRFDEAVQKMTAVRDEKFVPDKRHSSIYNRLYALYRRLHDIFGTKAEMGNCHDVMKGLLAIRDEVRVIWKR